MEYRATITCTQDPCTYCGTPDDRPPATTYILVRNSRGGFFKTADEALEHARKMAIKVYGASVHRGGVQRRYVGEWETVQPDDLPSLLDSFSSPGDGEAFNA